jgi:hypothetical protein
MEYMYHPHNFKGQLCQNYKFGGSCPKKNYCAFAHGPHELRGRNGGGTPPSPPQQPLHSSSVGRSHNGGGGQGSTGQISGHGLGGLLHDDAPNSLFSLGFLSDNENEEPSPPSATKSLSSANGYSSSLPDFSRGNLEINSRGNSVGHTSGNDMNGGSRSDMVHPRSFDNGSGLSSSHQHSSQPSRQGQPLHRVSSGPDSQQPRPSQQFQLQQQKSPPPQQMQHMSGSMQQRPQQPEQKPPQRHQQQQPPPRAREPLGATEFRDTTDQLKIRVLDLVDQIAGMHFDQASRSQDGSEVSKIRDELRRSRAEVDKYLEQVRALTMAATNHTEPGLGSLADQDITYFAALPQIKADDMEQQAHLVLAKLKTARDVSSDGV